MIKSLRFAIAAVSAVVALSPNVATADGTTIKIGVTAGGGYDMAGRLMARHLPRHLEQEQDGIVQNVSGASSLNLARQLAVDVDDDTLGMVLASLIINSRLDPEKVAVDFSEFHWIGSLNSATSVCLVSKASGVKTLENFAKSALRIGATSKVGGFYQFAALAQNVLDADYQIVSGFKGLTDIEAAVDRGELDGYCGSQLDRFVRNGQSENRQLIGALTVSVEQDGETLPPMISAVSDPLDRAAVELFATRDSMYYPVMMSPGTSQQAVDRYRNAFAAMIADPAFLEEAGGMYLTVTPMTGDAVAEMVGGVSNSDADTVDRLKEFLE